MSEFEETPDLVEKTFDEYVAAFSSGQGDPSPFLDRFQGRQRQELELLIEAFIATGPVSTPDPDDPAFNAVFEKVLSEVDGESGGLSEFLATLRQKAGKTQAAVVAALSESLKASPEETEKIDSYYHQLEWGSLPASGLSETLYGHLGKILAVNPDSLRDAAASPGPRYGGSAGPIFARSERIELADDASVAHSMAAPTELPATDPDRIDQLFTGG